MSDNRKIIHLDMDAFFAAVECLDDPSLCGKPLVVGGSPQSRGVVATASYEARRFGIRSAMPTSQAYRLCPQAVFVPARISRYREVSECIFKIFREHTDLVEPVSLDEAYLDVTENNLREPSATRLAVLIQKEIYQQTSLTASAGVAPNKFLAKVASDMRKPAGLTVISPENVAATLKVLAVGKVPGIGKVTEAKLLQLGVKTVGDMQAFSEAELVGIFGKSGSWFYRIAQGIDQRAVVPDRRRKSLGAEDTFARDLLDLDELKEQLRAVVLKVHRRLEAQGVAGRTFTLKTTYSNFEKITRSRTEERVVTNLQSLQDIAESLLRETEAGSRPIRLLGFSITNFSNEDTSLETFPKQLSFPFFL